MIVLRTDPTPGYVLRIYVGAQTHRSVANVSQHCSAGLRSGPGRGGPALAIMAYFVNRRFVMGYARVTIGKPVCGQFGISGLHDAEEFRAVEVTR